MTAGLAMNWMQKEAMLVLLRKEQASMKDLRPRDVQANLFAYHFEELIHKGYIEKVGRGLYRLTPLGHRFSGTISADLGVINEELRTVVMLYGKKRDEYLLFKRSRQPHIGKVGLLHDHMHRDWSLEVALENALSEKLGTTQVGVSYKKSMIIRICHHDVVVSHMNALVYEIDIDEIRSALPFTSKNGTVFVSKLDAVPDSELFEGMEGLIQAIEDREPGILHEAVLGY